MGNTSGKALPFTLGEKVTGFRFATLWQVSAGASIDGSARVLVWRFDKRSSTRQADHALVRNAYKRMRTLRHPYVLKCIDGAETEDGFVYTLVTEEAIPLSLWLQQHKGEKDFEASCVWGLYSLCTALSFLHSDCKMLHGCLTTDAVWVTKGGDWKLGGFELLSDVSGSKDWPSDTFVDNERSGQYPDSHKSPERAEREWGGLATHGPHALDIYSLGILIAEASSGGQWVRSASDAKAIASGTWSGTAAIPSALRPLLPKLLAASPRARPSATTVLDCSWFKQPLVGCLLFLDELALKEPKDKARFFSSLPNLVSRFPVAIARFRVLPALVQALEYGAAGGGGTVALAPILDIGQNLSAVEYAAEIAPCVVKLFTSNDRATRVHLLSSLPSFLDKMDDALINGSIFPSILNGYTDTNAVLRETTVKATVHIAPRLSKATFDSVLLRLLKICLVDAEPAIRVNTTICLGRVAEFAAPASREAELLPCFLRSMRDPFPPTRAAAMRAIAHCINLGKAGGFAFWEPELLASRVLPAAAHLALFPVSDVRSSSLLVLDLTVALLKEKAAEIAAVEEKAAARGEREGAGVTGPPSVSQATTAPVARHGSGVAGAGAGAAAGSAMIGALGWAVSGIASLAVSGSMDGGHGVGGQGGQNSVQAQSQHSQPASSGSGPVSTLASAAAAPVDSKAGRGGAMSLNSSSSAKKVKLTSTHMSSDTNGWGDTGSSAAGDGDGWGDAGDFDDDVVKRGHSSSALAGVAADSGMDAKVQVGSSARHGDDAMPADKGWAMDGGDSNGWVNTDALPLPVPSMRRPQAGDGTADANSGSPPPATASKSAKSMSLKGAATRIEPKGKGGSGADGWDEW